MKINLSDENQTEELVDNQINELITRIENNDNDDDDATTLLTIARSSSQNTSSDAITHSHLLSYTLQQLVSKASFFSSLWEMIYIDGNFLIDESEAKILVELVEALVSNQDTNKNIKRQLRFHQSFITTNAILYLANSSSLVERGGQDNNAIKSSSIFLLKCTWMEDSVNLKPSNLILSSRSFPVATNVRMQNVIFPSKQDAQKLLRQCQDFENQTVIKIKSFEIVNSSILSKEAGQYLLSLVRKTTVADQNEEDETIISCAKLQKCELHYTTSSSEKNNDNKIKFTCWQDEQFINNSKSNIYKGISTIMMNRYQFQDCIISKDILDYFLGQRASSMDESDTLRFSSHSDFTNCQFQTTTTSTTNTYLQIDFFFEWLVSDNLIAIPSDCLANDNDASSLQNLMALLAEFEPFQQIAKLQMLSDDNSDIGVKCIAQNLNQTNLQELSLCNVGMGDEGVESLGAALQSKHSKLLHLDISANADISSKSLANLLQGSSSLKSLTMNDMFLEDDHVMKLADVLKSNTTLERLEISENWDITNVGMTCLLKVLEESENTTLNNICYDFSQENAEDCTLHSKIDFYLSLNRLGRGELLKDDTNTISISLFPLILAKADSDDASVLYWLVNTFSHVIIIPATAAAAAASKRKIDQV